MVPVFRAIAWSFEQLKRPDILALIIIPCLVHSFLLFTLVYLLYSWLNGLTIPASLPSIFAFTQGWASFNDIVLSIIDSIRWLIIVVICFGMVGLGLTVTATIAHLLASPFNGWLSTRAESLLRPIDQPEITFLHAFQVGLSREWQRLKYVIIRALPLALCTVLFFWVPVLNSLVSVSWIAFGAWMLGLQAVDYVADNNGFTFQQTLAQCRRSKIMIISLGAIQMAMMLAPGLNLLSMALSVLSGTYLWVHYCVPQTASVLDV